MVTWWQKKEAKILTPPPYSVGPCNSMRKGEKENALDESGWIFADFSQLL